MYKFPRIAQLPPYVFSVIDKLKETAIARGDYIYDFGMGNPDIATPDHILTALQQAIAQDGYHRYSVSKGIHELREAFVGWYQRRYGLTLDQDKQVVACMGSKEGIGHLAYATTGPADTVWIPDPTYPIHRLGFQLAGANVVTIPLHSPEQYLAALEKKLVDEKVAPTAVIINFPANPTALCVEQVFYEKIIALAKKYQFWILNDMAYADITFDGYEAPSILTVKDALDYAVETYTLSKSYNMPGWRVGFVYGNAELTGALIRIKSYLDYGMFAPIQQAAVSALNGTDECVDVIRQRYQRRRDLLCDGLNALGWPVIKPKASMFVWAKIPLHYRSMGSLAFTEYLIEKAKVAVSPGMGFGDDADDYVRFSLVVNEENTQKALLNIRECFAQDCVV